MGGRRQVVFWKGSQGWKKYMNGDDKDLQGRAVNVLEAVLIP